MSHYGTFDQYLKFCELFDQFGFQARIYTSPDLATYDTLQSLIHMVPHKNKIAFIHRGNYLMDIVSAVALKNQQQVIQKKLTENIVIFLESLETSVHTFVWSLGHHFTNEIYYNEKQVLEILEICHRKKIFSICLLDSRSEIFLQKLQLKEQSQYALFIEVPSLFEVENKNSILYLSEKLKLSLLVGGLQNLINNTNTQNINKQSIPILLKAQKNSALAIKEFLKLNDSQAFTLAELPFWVTDKWSVWWPEINQPDFIRHTLILSSEYTEQNPNYLSLIEKAELEISQNSSWVIS